MFDECKVTIHGGKVMAKSCNRQAISQMLNISHFALKIRFSHHNFVILHLGFFSCAQAPARGVGKSAINRLNNKTLQTYNEKKIIDSCSRTDDDLWNVARSEFYGEGYGYL